MKLVVDANIAFSFFKKESLTRELILDPNLKYDLELFSLNLMLKEIGRLKNEIRSKSGISDKDFDVMFSSLPVFIKIVKDDLFKKFLPKAEKILSPHTKDVPYVALCLSFKDKGYEIGLWSNEERLKILEKLNVKVFSTSKLIEELE